MRKPYHSPGQDEKLILLYCPGRGLSSRPPAHRSFKHGQGVPRPYPLGHNLKKACDTVDHGILINKLKHYGVWLKSYLSNRKQFVNIDGCSSELLDVICGVPQGSILGPTLFIL